MYAFLKKKKKKLYSEGLFHSEKLTFYHLLLDYFKNLGAFDPVNIKVVAVSAKVRD